MFRIPIRLAAAAAGALAATAAIAPAVAATYPAAPAGSVFSPEQAGYQVSHGTNTYRNVTATFLLPDAGNYAANVGSFGLSVQGWGPSAVVVLGVSTCATDTCATGGNPVNEPWSPAMAVYDTSTHALITTGTPATFSMAAGDSVTEDLYYNPKSGNVQAKLTDNTTHAVYTAVYAAGLNHAYRSVRAGLETSAVSPWGNPAFTYNAPAEPVTIASFTGVAVTTTKGKGAHLLDTSYATAAPVTWTRNGQSNGAVDASSSAPTSNGEGFSVSLQP